jgi:hypothetical protein
MATFVVLASFSDQGKAPDMVAVSEGFRDSSVAEVARLA